MAKSNEPKEMPRIVTRLGKNTAFKGTLRFTESVQVAGSFEGEIFASGFLYIQDGAQVRANVRAKAIVVGGTVRGNIEAEERLEILATGKIYGNVRTRRLRIADGVVFEGKCEMVRGEQSVDVFSAPLDQLRETVQRV